MSGFLRASTDDSTCVDRPHSLINRLRQMSSPRYLLAGLALVFAGGSASSQSLIPTEIGESHVRSFISDDVPLTVECKTGTVQLDVEVTGELDCVDKSTVESDCAWTVRIIDSLPQGAQVNKGDVVMTLDSSDLESRARRERIDVVEAQAQLDQARERLEMQKITNESRLAAARLAFDLAKIDLETYRDGSLPRLKSTQAGNVELARESVVRAQESFEFTARMARKGYESPISVEKSRIALRKAEHKLSVSMDQYNLLQDHEQVRTLVELDAKVTRRRDELARAEAETAISLRSRQMDVVTREQRLKSQQDYLTRLEDGIAACRIVAPRNGRVVIARPRSSRTASQTLQPGDLVYRKQALFDIPRFDQLNVEVSVHETMVRHVRPGQSVEVRVDAQPDTAFHGEVISVASVPTSASYPNYDLKVYKAIVKLDDSAETVKDLRPGLTARATIVADFRIDCRYVPSQAIVTVKGQPSVFVTRGDRIEVRPVELGLTTESKVEIVNGLQADESVVLSPKTEYSEQILAMMR